jgi:hypothetical protein
MGNVVVVGDGVTRRPGGAAHDIMSANLVSKGSISLLGGFKGDLFL